MTLHPPTHAQNVATCNNSCVRSKPEQRSPTVFWPTTVQISLRPLAIILSKPKPLPFIIGDSITRTQRSIFLPLSCQWCAESGSYQRLRNKCQIFRKFLSQLMSHCRAIVEEFISCACVLIHFVHVQVFATPWTVACQVPLPMGFSRQEYWSGLPFPPPGTLLDPESETVSLMSPAMAGRLLTPSTTWEAFYFVNISKY